jgi:uncharacterized protein (TIGR00255 family)
MNQTKVTHSMTGFAAIEDTLFGRPAKVEIRSLNHRFLDVKVRLPQDLSSVDFMLRGYIQKQFKRGSVDFKLEFLQNPSQEITDYKANVELAQKLQASLKTLLTELNLQDSLELRDLIQMPGILQRISGSDELTADPKLLFEAIEPLAAKATQALIESRRKEGLALKTALTHQLQHLKETTHVLREKRDASEGDFKAKIKEKVTKFFDSYSLENIDVQTVLEKRISQELAIILDRTDIEEELTRLKSHLDHFQDALQEGSPMGRKLEFILQELNREITTLGNKAQDFSMSENVVSLKVALEQMREQTLNIE